MNELAIKNIKSCITILAVIIALICTILQFRSCNRPPVEPEIIVQRDTFVVRDTITKKVFIKQDVYHFDTVVINDTVYIKDEPRHYIDSTELYKVDIEAVKLYNYTVDIYRSDTVYTEKYTEIIKQPKKFGQFVGVGLGVNYGLDPVQGKFVPTVGVSIVYGFGYRW